MAERKCYCCGHVGEPMFKVAPWNGISQLWCANSELCRARVVATKLEADGYFSGHFGGWKLVGAELKELQR